MSTIISLDIRLNDLIISNDPTGVYSIINEIGVYNLSIYAEDIHGLSNFVFSKIEIIDDDICPPELSNLVITHDIHNVNISFDAIDQSGIEDTIILVNGEIIEPISQTKAGHTYFFTLENQWILKNGIYEVEIQVKDADNDRPNDDLSSSIIGIFEITLKDMYEYVDWQLEELQKYITENLCWIFRWILNRKLLHAQEHLEEAYCLSESGKITSGLFHDIVAKIILRITEFRTEIFNKINFINNEDAEYIINSIHTIRNNIVILMGASVGTEQAYNIALIEVKLLNLNDFIEEELNWWISRCVRNHISSAARYLECAIFKLSINADIDCALTKAQWKLEMAECKIKCLLKRGKISQDLADNLLQKIEDVQTDIEKVKNLI